jgi:hypothetical protein
MEIIYHHFGRGLHNPGARVYLSPFLRACRAPRDRRRPRQQREVPWRRAPNQAGDPLRLRHRAPLQVAMTEIGVEEIGPRQIVGEHLLQSKGTNR